MKIQPENRIYMMSLILYAKIKKILESARILDSVWGTIYQTLGSDPDLSVLKAGRVTLIEKGNI
jgi:hypothetical protein